MDEKLYKVSELAEKAGVSKRTIHYYIGRGLLPPAIGSGVSSFYTEKHLSIIIRIKEMQEKYLPLDEIRKQLSQNNDSLNKNDPATPANRHTNNKNIVDGQSYKRIILPYGIELHIPAESIEAEKFAQMIILNSKKMEKER